MITGGHLFPHSKNRPTLLLRIPEVIRRGTYVSDEFTFGRGWEVGGFHGWKLRVSSSLGKKITTYATQFFILWVFFFLFSSELHFHSANGKLT
jgi:hypothetical protein